MMNCTYSGAPKTSAIIAVNAPAAISRNVISPVVTCTLMSKSIIMSQKDQKFSRTHTSKMASQMCVHCFRILLYSTYCRQNGAKLGNSFHKTSAKLASLTNNRSNLCQSCVFRNQRVDYMYG